MSDLTPDAKCKICNKEGVEIIYNGPLKTGLLDGYTRDSYPVFRCKSCGTMWHNASDDNSAEYYESTEYRNNIEVNPTIEEFYNKHDVETLFKLKITGTGVYRNKLVADIGCGGGSFLDFIRGVSKETIAVEPSKEYQKTLKKKYHTYSYASEALNDWRNKLDLVVSFDVIEHVPNPHAFIKEAFELLKEGGEVCIGTPTDYPILREMLGDAFNKFIFQIHHPWILSKKIMKDLAEEVGFESIDVYCIQKYGLGNLICWLSENKPRGNITYDFITPSMNEVYMNEAVAGGFGEYIVLKAKKPKK